jgi:hypothetical protein
MEKRVWVLFQACFCPNAFYFAYKFLIGMEPFPSYAVLMQMEPVLAFMTVCLVVGRLVQGVRHEIMLHRENIEKRVGVLRGLFNPLMRLCVVHIFMSAIHLHNIMHDAHVLFSRHVICACVCVQENSDLLTASSGSANEKLWRVFELGYYYVCPRATTI